MNDFSQAPPGRSLLERIGVNTVLNALVMLVGLTAWAVTVHNQADQSSRELVRLEASMTDKISDLHNATMSGLADVRNQLATLPDQRARIDGLERRAADLDTRIGSLGSIIAAQEQSEAQSRADINAMLRTLNQPISPRTR